MKRICATCEYFDGGGEVKLREALQTGSKLPGDCLNALGSPRFETMSDQTCRAWHLSSTLPEIPA